MATREPSSFGGSVTIDQLIALNDEMAALIRAGVPLERSLVDAGRDLQGRLGKIVGDLGERLGQGERLPEAVAGSGRSMPDIYRAVVEAGLRSGRLSQALEGMATIARGYADARRAIGLALIYPLIVVAMSYALSLLFVLQIAPRFVKAFDSLGLAPMRPLGIMADWGEWALYWAPIPPLLLLVLGFYWAWMGRSASLESGHLGPLLRRIPVVGPMISYFREASFAELLALLLEHQVPLDESIRLAGEACGDQRFRCATLAFAEAIRRGEGTQGPVPTAPTDFPPLLAWMLTAGRGQGNLSASLRHAARNYRRRAESRGEILRSALPTVFMLSIGAVAVVIYSLMLFVPLATLWDELSLPVN